MNQSTVKKKVSHKRLCNHIAKKLLTNPQYKQRIDFIKRNNNPREDGDYSNLDEWLRREYTEDEY